MLQVLCEKIFSSERERERNIRCRTDSIHSLPIPEIEKKLRERTPEPVTINNEMHVRTYSSKPSSKRSESFSHPTESAEGEETETLKFEGRVRR